MSKPRAQTGHVFEFNKAFHIRYYVHENGVRKQKSHKLCQKNDLHPAKNSPSVVRLAEDFISKINEANGTNDAHPGHNCPICGNRCPRTVQGKFAKKVPA